MDSDFLKIAVVSKTHGIKGEIFICPFNPQASWPSDIFSIKIGERIFSVEYYSAHKQGFIMKLKNCDNKESAEKLKSLSVFAAKKYFISQKDENIYLAELIHFSVQLSGQNIKGKILEFCSDKHQDFLVVSFGFARKNSNCLIPFTSSYIQTIDFKKKQLVLKLPENFLTVFKAK